MDLNKEVFFHVGTGKTGTTFLQYRAFPKFEGVHYIQRTQFRKAESIIRNSNETRFFISWEMDQQLEHEVAVFAQKFPDTQSIIVFRPHDSYLASQYRRFVKNGFSGSLQDFFDLKEDKGFFKIADMSYMRQIEILEKYFTKKPIVLLYEDLSRDPKAFVSRFASLVGATVNVESIDYSKKHTSYNEKQLKAMQAMGKHFNMRKRRVFKNGFLHLLWKIGFGALRYGTLYGAKLIPASRFDPNPLMNSEELEAVKNYFQKDWEEVVSYANKNQRL